MRRTLPPGLRFLPFRNPPRKTAFVLRSTTCSSPAWQPVERSHSICPMLPCFARPRARKRKKPEKETHLTNLLLAAVSGLAERGESQRHVLKLSESLSLVNPTCCDQAEGTVLDLLAGGRANVFCPLHHALRGAASLCDSSPLSSATIRLELARLYVTAVH